MKKIHKTASFNIYVHVFDKTCTCIYHFCLSFYGKLSTKACIKSKSSLTAFYSYFIKIDYVIIRKKHIQNNIIGHVRLLHLFKTQDRALPYSELKMMEIYM